MNYKDIPFPEHKYGSVTGKRIGYRVQSRKLGHTANVTRRIAIIVLPNNKQTFVEEHGIIPGTKL